MMAGIRSQNTRLEMALRQGLHSQGFRFRLHDRKLAGTPDLVFAKHQAVLFAHGCFWHGHDCHLFKWPKTRAAFWRAKIARNQAANARALSLLQLLGWRTCVVWECAIKGRTALPGDAVIVACADWLAGGQQSLDVRGTG